MGNPGDIDTHLCWHRTYILFLRKILPTVGLSWESIITNVPKFKTNLLSASQCRWQWRQEVLKVC